METAAMVHHSAKDDDKTKEILQRGALQAFFMNFTSDPNDSDDVLLRFDM
jgi:hypothetical protein